MVNNKSLSSNSLIMKDQLVNIGNWTSEVKS